MTALSWSYPANRKTHPRTMINLVSYMFFLRGKSCNPLPFDLYAKIQYHTTLFPSASFLYLFFLFFSCVFFLYFHSFCLFLPHSLSFSPPLFSPLFHTPVFFLYIFLFPTTQSSSLLSSILNSLHYINLSVPQTFFSHIIPWSKLTLIR